MKSLLENQIGFHNHGYIWMFPKIVGFPPKHPLKNRGFPYFSHPFWGVSVFLETPILVSFFFPVASIDLKAPKLVCCAAPGASGTMRGDTSRIRWNRYRGGFVGDEKTNN